LNRHKEAIASYKNAVALKPDFALAHWNTSLSALASGDFPTGWKLYEWRKKLAKPVGLKTLPYPESTDLKDMAGRKVLIHSEQGFGDIIQFCRYLPKVAEIASSVTVVVPTPLLGLLHGAFAGVAAIKDADIPADIDTHCPMASLPLAFGTTLQTIPATVPYLFAARSKADAFAGRLGTKSRPRVGLVWSGGSSPDRHDLWSLNVRRNIDFSILSRLNLSGIDFFSLQKGEPAESALIQELPCFWSGDNFHNLTWDIKDFSDTAALIENLDLVVSVDTSTAHLAGAMGRPVWILNRFDVEWRWAIEPSRSPWYPTARLFRQPEPDAWPQVIEDVRNELIEQFNL
jgi:hypothetical protein